MCSDTKEMIISCRDCIIGVRHAKEYGVRERTRNIVRKESSGDRKDKDGMSSSCPGEHCKISNVVRERILHVRGFYRWETVVYMHRPAICWPRTNEGKQFRL